MNKKIEDKAIEYVKSVDFSNSTGVYILNEMEGVTFMGYLEGYNQATADQTESLTQHKELLRKLIPLAERGMNAITALTSERDVINIAKRLLNEI